MRRALARGWLPARISMTHYNNKSLIVYAT